MYLVYIIYSMKVKHGKAIEITDQLSPQDAEVIAQWIGSYTVIKNQKIHLAQQAYQQWKAAGEDKENYPVVNQQVAFLNQSLPFSAEDLSNSFYLSRKGRRFWFSMSYNKEVNALSETKIKDIIKNLSDEALKKVINGYDLGIVQQVTGSDDAVYHIDNALAEKIGKIEKKRSKYQRRYLFQSAMCSVR